MSQGHYTDDATVPSVSNMLQKEHSLKVQGRYHRFVLQINNICLEGFKTLLLRAREKTMFAKCLLHNLKDLSSDPQHPYKKLDIVA